ncbi:MAG: outer membrane beta-barrel protein, partial [Bacteroidales bacterium]|nr:outer membrane beta-barrel protein [Bacteroidales bacterium]
MKKLVIVLLVFTTGIGSYGNPDTTRVKVGKNEVVKIVDDNQGTDISVGKKGFIKYNDKDDTIKVKIGKKGIKIIENEDGTSIDIIDLDEIEDEKDFNYKRKFKGHWKGFEMGLNNFSTEGSSLILPASDNFMNLNTGKSWNVNINFLQYGLGLIGNNIGIVTGLGLELNDYRFDNNNTIIKDDDNGMIVGDPYVLPLEKSKFATSYLTAPLLLELQVPTGKRNKMLFLSGGVIGGLKIGSHTKVVYREGGNKQKVKDRGDFNLSPFRYGVTARVGYRALKVFANFYLTPLFEDG